MLKSLIVKDRFVSKLVVFIFAVFVILLTSVIYTSSKKQVSPISPPVTALNISPSFKTATPHPTLVVLIASQNIIYRSTSNYPPLFSVMIPKGAKYYQDVEPLEIQFGNGLSVTICSTCQLFIPDCGGLSDGNVVEGGCAITPVTLGRGIIIGSHYQVSEPDKILGFYDNYKNSQGETISVRATTGNFRKLTGSDKSILYSLISSLK